MNSPDREDLRDVADEIKRLLVDPIRVCQQLGLADGERKTKPFPGVCPSKGCGRNTPAFSVTNAPDGGLRAKCHSCGFSADVLGLIAQVYGLATTGDDFVRVVDIGCELAGISRTRPMARPALRPVPPPPKQEPVADLTDEWNALRPVDEDCWEYLRSRGLADAADFCRTTDGADGKLGEYSARGYRLAQALRDKTGRVVAIQVRRLEGTSDDKAKRFLIHGPAAAGMFGDPLAVAKEPCVVVCEGFTDTLAASIAFAGKRAAVVGVAGTQSTAELATLPLAGKRVAVLFDADGPGDVAAQALVADLEKRGASVRRVRPKGGKDVADMLVANVNIPAFVQATRTGFRSIAETISEERRARVAATGKYLEFGTRFLDDALGGIAPTDLVLIGAATGRGKTQFATGIARHNALQGKRVHYLALEADEYEIERRIKYPLVASLAYAERDTNGDLYRRLNYLDWIKGSLDGVPGVDMYERAAEVTIAAKYPTLFTRYKKADRFGKKMLEETIREIADETDLICVDHLHYLDLDGNAANENKETREIVQTLRNLNGELDKPIILVAHIRKGDKKKKALVPSIEEFHGTSDTSKTATKAIMIAPAPDHAPTKPHHAPTFIEPAKCRADGSRTYYTGLVEFNFRTGKYEDAYALGKLDQSREKFLFVGDDDLPDWSKRRPSTGATVIGGVEFDR